MPHPALRAFRDTNRLDAEIMATWDHCMNTHCRMLCAQIHAKFWNIGGDRTHGLIHACITHIAIFDNFGPAGGLVCRCMLHIVPACSTPPPCFAPYWPVQETVRSCDHRSYRGPCSPAGRGAGRAVNFQRRQTKEASAGGYSGALRLSRSLPPVRPTWKVHKQ